ncbi:MAG: hypothetical protein V1688_01030 [bacterium]
MENLTDKKIDNLIDEMHNSFDEMRRGFKNHDQRFDDLTDEMHKGFKEMHQGFADFDKKIDDLALATSQGFDDVYKRFEAIDQRFEAIDQRFDVMEIENQNRHNELTNGNDKMVRTFETSLQEMASSKFISDRHDDKLENHEKRIRILELSNAV